MRMKADMVDKISYEKCMALYKDRFKDASDFTFILVGNIDLATVKPLLETYLGSLPSINRKETFKDLNLNIRKGELTNVFSKQQEIAKATVLALYSGNCKFNLQNNVLMSMVDQVLNLVYTEKVREQEGGTYGVNVSGDITKFPKEEFELQVFFQTDPAKKDKLTKIIFDEANALAKDGPSEANLAKVKEYILKAYKEKMKENGFWLNNINEFVYTGVDMTANYEAIVNKVTTADIKAFAQFLFNQKNRIEVTMTAPQAK